MKNMYDAPDDVIEELYTKKIKPMTARAQEKTRKGFLITSLLLSTRTVERL